MSTKVKTGRSFLGTLFIVGLGFILGMYHAEIVSLAQQIAEQIKNR